MAARPVTTRSARSSDGTSLGLDLYGDGGPVVVMVSGGLDDGTENLPLARHLAARHRVVVYRRRGRGDSGDTAPYAVEREIEDLAAVIATTGERAHLFGASSGGALALEAAAAGVDVDRVAVHEVPYLIADEMLAAWRAYREDLDAALDADDRDRALRLFMRLAGSNEADIAAARHAPVWPALRDLAPTLRYDAACLGDGRPPADRLGTLTRPVLLTTGATVDPNSAGLPVDFFGAAADAVASCLPDARRVTFEVAGHIPDPAVIGPVLSDFYSG